jgi:hypothetical protein
MASLAERFPQKEPRRPKIPGYEVGEVVGRGATGVVFRARQQAVDREVALKVLHASLSEEPRVIQRLQREARTTARLAHPHVVSAIDMGQTGGQWWYAMEFVDGPSLAGRLRQEGRLTEREALRLFIPLCEALEHLWEHGVVHRDIKPANILIDRAGGARLADLGLAFADDDPSVTKPGGTLGTPHYISPEQTVDPRQADVRSDIWSFGATLFHAVCGRTPFTGDSAAEILSNVLYSRVPDPRELEPSLSKGLTLILRKCLVREPEGRYQTPHELLLDMERVRERRQPKVSRRALDPVQKQRDAWKIWLPVAAILLLGVGIPFLLLGPLTSSGTQAGTAKIGRQGELLPYGPLEALDERSQRDEPGQLALLAQYRSELAALKRNLPEVYEPRWAELDRKLSEELGRRVRELRHETKIKIQRELEAQDYRAASAILDVDFSEDVFDRTGYRPAQLEGEGVPIDPWVKVQRREIDQRAGAAAEELQEALGNWSMSVRTEVDRLKAAQEWSAALELLVEGRDAILAAANLANFPLPEALLDAAVDNTRTEMFAKRLEVKDEWTSQDHKLHRWVAERTRSLRSELENGPPRPPVAENLADAFTRELDRRRLSRTYIEELPRGLQRTCLEELDRSVSSLRALEEKLLENDARADMDETVRFCEPLWQARSYEEAESLWIEAVERLRALDKRTTKAWRSELETAAAIRREEARLLSSFLGLVADHVRDLDGQVIDSMTMGLVDYFKVRIESGDDPLADGFRAKGVRLYLRQPPAETAQPGDVLRSEQLERFYTDADAELSEVDRLTLAAYRFYEDRFDDARAMLRGGPVPEDGVQGEIQADLLKRVFDSIEVDQAQLQERQAIADDLLARIDQGNQARAPSAVQHRVERLINEYADLPQVRERLSELRALSRQLRQHERPTEEVRIRRIYDPNELSFPSSREVVMAFDFGSLRRGAWQRGDWIYDGAGWARTDKVQRWEELAEQRGPRLFLNEPLDPDSLQVDFTFEQTWEGPPQLVLISVGGFHVAFCGSGLPGEQHEPRYLIGTGALEEFVEQIRGGEGTPDDQLIRRDETHTVRLSVYRPGGSGSRLKLEFDGRPLAEVPRALVHEDVPSIEFRSWEPVTLKRIVIETGR